MHGRGENGGNLLHEIARSPDLKPQTVVNAFKGYPDSKSNTSRKVFRGGITDKLSAGVIRKALTLKDRSVFTPKDLAEHHNNRTALHILKRLSKRHRQITVEQREISLLLGITGVTGMALGHYADTIPPEAVLIGVPSGIIASVCAWTFFSGKNKKLP